MRIFFIIDHIWDYRLPLYRMLSQIFDIEFLLTGSQRLSGELAGLRCRVIDSKAKLISTLLTGSHNIVIWGHAGTGRFASNLLNGVISLIISRLRGKPFIVWFGGWEFMQEGIWRGGKVVNAVKRIGAASMILWLLRSANAVVTYGRFHRSFYASLGVDPGKIFIAPNTSIIHENQSEVEKQAALLRAKLGLEGKKVILYVGRLEKRKNVDILIKAFAMLKRDDACLIIIGDGRLRPHLEKLCEKLEARNIYFLGRIEREKLPPYYCLCDVFVYPTSREPWGLAINEAMQFGKPVITTPGVAAAYDLVRPGLNGFIVPERDSQALAEAINKVLSDEKLALRMGRYSREIIEQGFTYEHMAKGFIQAIRYCIKSEKHRR